MIMSSAVDNDDNNSVVGDDIDVDANDDESDDNSYDEQSWYSSSPPWDLLQLSSLKIFHFSWPMLY